MALDTKHGRIVVELFDDVPVHRANFLYKVYRRYFDPSEFTRVVPDFVVQGGNSEEERPQQLRFLIGQHTLPAEFRITTFTPVGPWRCLGVTATTRKNDRRDTISTS